ncbi:unnamed protein product [Mesocestoides corti]|uniref:Uncharacterized protein n=1 Tax=Mesocestoides corti TaxID=53468 RepID=A0A0R3U770_MESCO|nr:unnamed protein product [Mesocestoides corti]
MAKVEFGDCSWFMPLVEQTTVNSVHSRQSFLTESHKTCLADRYFTTCYFPDVGDEEGNDLCVMQHSNRVCVIGLAPGHHLFRGCSSAKSSKSTEADASVPFSREHQVLGVDFQLSQSFNLLDTKISGRRKRGSHHLQHPSQCIGYAVCDQGERHPLVSGLPGRLYESNSRLALNSTNRIPLAPIGHSGNNLAYLAVVMPPRGRADEVDIRSKRQSVALSADDILARGLTWEAYKSLRNL